MCQKILFFLIIKSNTEHCQMSVIHNLYSYLVKSQQLFYSETLKCWTCNSLETIMELKIKQSDLTNK